MVLILLNNNNNLKKSLKSGTKAFISLFVFGTLCCTVKGLIQLH